MLASKQPAQANASPHLRGVDSCIGLLLAFCLRCYALLYVAPGSLPNNAMLFLSFLLPAVLAFCLFLFPVYDSKSRSAFLRKHATLSSTCSCF